MPFSAPLEPLLLHEHPLVRDSVGFHFYESWPRDERLSSLVLESYRRHGEEATLNLLSFGCRFPLGDHGLDESLSALAASYPPFVDQWIATAPLDLLNRRLERVRSVVSSRAMRRVDRRLALRGVGVEELWRRLDELCHRLDDRTEMTREWDELEDIEGALASRERRETVLDRLIELDSAPSRHLRSAIVDVAGAMSRGTYLPYLGLLVTLLGEEDEGVRRAAVQAIGRVGSAPAVRAIIDRYRLGSRRFRRSAISALKAIKLDASEARLRGLLQFESHPELRGRIFDALRFHFTPESEALLGSELESPTSWMIPEEIRKALYVFARIRGVDDVEWQGAAEVYFHIPFPDPSAESL